jgi:tripartite-type tricarboxylate transporter receptor subunit TctC
MKAPPDGSRGARQTCRKGKRIMSFRAFARHALTLLAVLGLSLGATPSGAQTYPAKKITIIVAFAPGGFADTMARLTAQGLGEELQQTVVVENRPGAGGNIAAALVAHAPADGYTLLATTTALAINETMAANKQYSANDLETVAMLTSSPEALLTNPSNPADTLPAFIKAMNGKVINFAAAGVGTGSHIEAEYFFKKIAKVPAQLIPFQGGSPAVTAVIGNQVDLLAATLSGDVAAQINDGRLKGLGIAAARRAAIVPNVPTYAEQGFPNFTAASWVGIFAPAKTDPRVLETLNSTINKVLASTTIKARLNTLGLDPITASQAEAEKTFREEIARWRDMVKALNLSIK